MFSGILLPFHVLAAVQVHHTRRGKLELEDLSFSLVVAAGVYHYQVRIPDGVGATMIKIVAAAIASGRSPQDMFK